MRALTLHRPWGWAIAAGRKPIENRTWYPPKAMIGKRIAIHAGKKLDEHGTWFIETLTGPIPHLAFAEGIIGTAVIGGTTLASESPWFSGPVGWRMEDPVLFQKAIPCRGAQALWRVPYELIQQIATAARYAP